MQHTVRYQMDALKNNLNKGDVILANHPKAGDKNYSQSRETQFFKLHILLLFLNVGGSHLPDLTVITPVFYPSQEKPVFFVANRGHHADIGGISPGFKIILKNCYRNWVCSIPPFRLNASTFKTPVGRGSHFQKFQNC